MCPIHSSLLLGKTIETQPFAPLAAQLLKLSVRFPMSFAWRTGALQMERNPGLSINQEKQKKGPMNRWTPFFLKLARSKFTKSFKYFMLHGISRWFRIQHLTNHRLQVALVHVHGVPGQLQSHAFGPAPTRK